MDLDHRTEIVEGDGGPLLRKWALSPRGVLALEREAERLERARHPGVVVLTDTAEDHIDLEWAGAESLALTRLTRGAATRILAIVAATVADLHDVGIVHGRIDESHVVLGPDLWPRLCGLRGVEHAGGGPGPADDVADLGALLERAIGMGADREVVPERRWQAWPRPGGRDRALSAIVERATDPDPARRPTARSLARSLAEVVPNVPGEPSEPLTSPSPAPEPAEIAAPDPAASESVERTGNPRDQPSRGAPARVSRARLMAGGPGAAPVRTAVHDITGPARPHLWIDGSDAGDARSIEPEPAPILGPAEDSPRPAPASRRALPIQVAAGLGLLVVAAAVLTLRQPSAPEAAPPVVAVNPIGGSAAVVSVPPTTTTVPVAPSTGTGPGRSTQGPTIDLGGSSYVVGEPGDRVTVADWDCDGSTSAGLVRPATGEVFLFDGWPTSGEITIAARARIEGARELVGPPPESGCRGPEVRLEDGTLVALAETGG